MITITTVKPNSLGIVCPEYLDFLLSFIVSYAQNGYIGYLHSETFDYHIGHIFLLGDYRLNWVSATAHQAWRSEKIIFSSG